MILKKIVLLCLTCLTRKKTRV